MRAAEEREANLAALVQQCAAGQSSALHQLYVAQASRLHGLAMRILNGPGLAADAVHDTFVHVWKRASAFDPERGNTSAWLTALVRYRALDIRRPRAREQLLADLPDREDESPDAFESLLGTMEAEALHRCLALLEPDRRQMLMSAYVEGFSHEELAGRYSVPLGTMKSLDHVTWDAPTP